jgi:hypothetical protein
MTVMRRPMKIFSTPRAPPAGSIGKACGVRINGLTLVTTNGWNPADDWDARKVTVTDDAGRSFTLRTPRYRLGAIPTGTCDAIRIFTQESGSGTDGTF